MNACAASGYECLMSDIRSPPTMPLFLGVTTNLDLAGHLVLLQNMFVMRPFGIRLSHN